LTLTADPGPPATVAQDRRSEIGGNRATSPTRARAALRAERPGEPEPRPRVSNVIPGVGRTLRRRTPDTSAIESRRRGAPLPRSNGRTGGPEQPRPRVKEPEPATRAGPELKRANVVYRYCEVLQR
jgi:hypothetical protein